jgi:hypothetical protein
MGKSSRTPRTAANGAPPGGASRTTSRPVTSGTAKGTSRPLAMNTANTAKTTSRPITGTAPAGDRAAAAKSIPAPRTTASAAGKPATETAAASARPASKVANKKVLRRKQAQREDQWKRWGPLVITLGSVALIVGLIIWLSSGGNNGNNTQLAPANVVNSVTNVSTHTFASVNTGGVTNPLQATPANTALLKNSAGLPVFLYVGAEYCPYCAAERWSMVVALSRFGTFKNLSLTTSSSTDVYPNTNTFTFVGSTYTSKYLDFQAVELEDRAGKSLQSLNAQQQQIFNQYDAPPYAPQGSSGGIPFIDIGNHFIQISTGYDPGILAGMTWQQIAQALSNPNSPVTRDIVGNANYLTAAICTITNNQPGSVCQTSTIQQIEQALPKGK